MLGSDRPPVADDRRSPSSSRVSPAAVTAPRPMAGRARPGACVPRPNGAMPRPAEQDTVRGRHPRPLRHRAGADELPRPPGRLPGPPRARVRSTPCSTELATSTLDISPAEARAPATASSVEIGCTQYVDPRAAGDHRHQSLTMAEARASGRLPAIGARADPGAVYPISGGQPGTTLASQLLGFVDAEGRGSKGVEQALRRSTPGGRRASGPAARRGAGRCRTRLGDRRRAPDRRRCG